MTDLQPIRTTVDLLKDRTTKEIKFDASDLILYLSPSISKDTKEYLTQLAADAQRVAFANSSTNILAGASDEGSDSGDVAIWLGSGDFGKGREAETLKALGLEDWIEMMRPNDLPKLELDPKLLSKLQDQHTFSIESSPYFFVFHLGRLEDGWGGLVAAGVWT